MKAETQAARLARCQALIDRQPLGVLFNNGDLMEFMELTREVVLAAVHLTNPTWPKDPRYVQVQWPEGNWEGFSWRNRIVPLTEKQRLKKVLQSAISKDLWQFRLDHPELPCARCGARSGLTTDHKNEPFDSIFQAFITLHPVIETLPGGQGDERVIANPTMAFEWRQFHTSRATYQILCVSCNSSKGKR